MAHVSLTINKQLNDQQPTAPNKTATKTSVPFADLRVQTLLVFQTEMCELRCWVAHAALKTQRTERADYDQRASLQSPKDYSDSTFCAEVEQGMREFPHQAGRKSSRGPRSQRLSYSNPPGTTLAIEQVVFLAFVASG